MRSTKITPKERVNLILNHQEADRVPLDIGGTVYTSLTRNALKKLTSYLAVSCNYEMFSEISQTCLVCNEIQKRLHSDFRVITIKNIGGDKLKEIYKNKYIDEWGVIWKKSNLNGGNYYYEVDGSPLSSAKSIDEIKNYSWPDFENEDVYRNLEAEAIELSKTKYAIVGSYDNSSIFGIFWQLRGFENFFMDLIINREFATIFMEKVINLQERRMVKFLEKTGKYLDVFCLNGDLGTQRSPLISPKTFRDIIKPLYIRIIKKAKNYTNAKIFYHSCGSIYPLIEDLIDCGIDILNPIQVGAKDMDTEKLKKEFGEKIVFWGGIDTQNILPFGSRIDVHEEVKLRINHLAKDGGYVVAPVHNIQSDVPPQNIIAISKAINKYGFYPIC